MAAATTAAVAASTSPPAAAASSPSSAVCSAAADSVSSRRRRATPWIFAAASSNSSSSCRSSPVAAGFSAGLSSVAPSSPSPPSPRTRHSMTCVCSGGRTTICSTTCGTEMTSCTGSAAGVSGGSGAVKEPMPVMEGREPMPVRNVESTVPSRGMGTERTLGFILSLSWRILIAATRASLSFSSSAARMASTSASTASRSLRIPDAAILNFLSSVSLLRVTTDRRCSISRTFSSAAATFSAADAALRSSASTVSGSFSSFRTAPSSAAALSARRAICDCCDVMVRSCAAHWSLYFLTRTLSPLASSMSARIRGGTSEPCSVSKSSAALAPVPPCSSCLFRVVSCCFCSFVFCSSRPRFSAIVSTSVMYSCRPVMRSPARSARVPTGALRFPAPPLGEPSAIV
mmetsp:Transcript_3999/g.9703  ORF Transcript_3999/g.9703 Transcript_3999/m.9703 type:complete len:402 (+) Transcript_3999:686-1891(+)